MALRGSFGECANFHRIRKHVARAFEPPDSFQWLSAVGARWPALVEAEDDSDGVEEWDEWGDDEMEQDQEQEIECDQRELDGVQYLVDGRSGKVYSIEEGNQFCGKLSASGNSVDLDAVDSSDVSSEGEQDDESEEEAEEQEDCAAQGKHKKLRTN